VLSSIVRSGVLFLTLLACALAALPGAASAADRPPAKTVAKDGPTGRYLLEGDWLFRDDRGNSGIKSRWYARTSSSGWSRRTVPDAFNANDLSNRSMGGGIVWYRKDFRLPARASDWLVRFESVRYRAEVWLNGRFIGRHQGAYLPWELRLRGLRRGTNRLVVRVNSRMYETDLPPGKMTIVGAPNGGWWNWGGILREVYLRRVNGIDIERAQVLPKLPCRTCDAGIDYRVTVTNYRSRASNVRVTGTFGSERFTVGAGRVGAGASRTFSNRLRVSDPHLWSPDDPHLYPVRITATGGGRADWTLHTGVRSFEVSGGRLLLNGQPTNFRGVFLHEDDPVTAGAVTPARMEHFFELADQIGATAMRTHYPMHPYIHELADRQGVLVWDEIPMFQMPSAHLAKPEVRRAAVRQLRDMVYANGNHASVFAWSLGNELNSAATGNEARYFREGAAAVRRLDTTRPVAYAIQGYPGAGCSSTYAPIELLGINTYFGWYPGPYGSIADRRRLGPYLDEMRECWPDKALAVTEFGAEANRDGPEEDRGTYQFQSKINDHFLSTYAERPWLAGAIGMLQEFRVRPGWSGGNPFPSSPPVMHQKGVFDFQGNPKPAAEVLRRWYQGTRQYDLPLGE
jgi:beta-glucuronidase